MGNELKSRVKQRNMLTLAYLGDSVFTLMVREALVKKYDTKPNSLNKRANEIVCAKAQAEFMEMIKPELNTDELDIVMRTRNAHLNSRAKNSTLTEYSLATQFEALIGYLYLIDDKDRILEIFNKYVAVEL